MPEEARGWHGIDFVQIPAGAFVMGSKDDDELAWNDEKPQHILEIPYDYWVAKFPVTNVQFRTFVRATSYETRAEEEGWAWVWDVGNGQWGKKEGASWKRPLGAGGSPTALAEHPVVQVCWYDALAYCAWLNQRFSDELQPGYHFRLPSEAEWEKAARGPGGHKWPWGNDFDGARCNSRDGGNLCTTSVRSLSPPGDSPYGVAGMSGNVWEWTLTLWGKDRDKSEFVYPYLGQDGRENQGAGDDFYRIIRGGSFKDDLKGVRSACRDLDPPYFSLNNLGFRVFAAPNLERQTPISPAS